MPKTERLRAKSKKAKSLRVKIEGRPSMGTLKMLAKHQIILTVVIFPCEAVMCIVVNV